VRLLAQIGEARQERRGTGSAELDRVLGGGLVEGSVVLLGGDPGIGKSTLLLQCLAQIRSTTPVLYVTGEESLEQVAQRGRRLGISAPDMALMAETAVESVLDTVARQQPAVVVIDSIQTLFTSQLQSAPGSVAQVRESAALLVRMAKARHCTVVLVGHVTKEGALAGPRVLEHMVDTVLYFEGDRSSRFRMIRSFKNRYGAVNEIGVFAMTEGGLKDVGNPSAMFVNLEGEPLPGSVVLATQEATRPYLVEVQALVDSGSSSQPRRLAVGVDGGRLNMLLAVLHRHGGLPLADQDVYINVAGGMRVSDTGADLALCAAVLSSWRDRSFPRDTVVFGEIGLTGEVRPVQRGLERLGEARKLGFRRAVIPALNRVRRMPDDMEIVCAKRITDLVDVCG
jgi:DNA repair protein RadA/Sms